MCICLHIYVYIYLHICIHIHIYIYIYIYMYICVCIYVLTRNLAFVYRFLSLFLCLSSLIPRPVSFGLCLSAFVSRCLHVHGLCCFWQRLRAHVIENALDVVSSDKAVLECQQIASGTLVCEHRLPRLFPANKPQTSFPTLPPATARGWCLAKRRTTCAKRRATCVLGRATCILGRATSILGRATSILGRATCILWLNVV